MDQNNILEESERSRRALLSLLEDQRLIQEDLRISEKKYKNLYEHIPVMYITVNSSGEIISTNPYVTDELGYTSQELINHYITDFIFEEDKLLASKQIEECFKNHETILQWEIRKVRKNGEIIWVHETARIMEEHEQSLLLIACQNITNQKKMQDTVQLQLHFANALNEIAGIIISSENSSTILEKTTDLIGITLNLDRCLIYDVSFSTRAVAGLCEWLNPAQKDLIPTIATYPLEIFIGGATTMMGSKKWLESHYNQINHSLSADGSANILHHKMAIKSLLWYPFSFRTDGFYLIVLNTTSERRVWKSEELDFLNSISKLANIAIEKIRLLDEKSRAINALCESEENYRFLADNTADILALLDLDFKYTYISPSVFRQRGYTVEEAMAQKLQENLTPESFKRAEALLMEELLIEASGNADPERIRSIELEQYRKDGSTLWIDVSLSFVRDNTGKATGIFAVSRDITKRKKLQFERERDNHIQEALNKILNISVEDIPLEKSLQKILEAITSLDFFSVEKKGAIFLADDNQSFLFLKAYYNIEPEIQSICLQVPFGECLCGKAAESRVAQFADCIDENHDIKYSGIKPHGHYNVPILSSDKVLGVITLYVEELHKKEEYEQEFLNSVVDILSGLIQRQKTENSLHESEMRYRQLFENSPIGIYRTTPDGRILAANTALLKMLNYRSLEDLQVINLEKENYTSYPRPSFKERLEREGKIVGLEAEWKKSDGTLITIRENVTTFRNNEGKIIYYDGTVEDITERKLAEEALRKSEQKFRTLAENIPDHIVRYNLDGRAVYLNHEQEQIRFFSSPIVGKLPTENQLDNNRTMEEYQKRLHKVIETGEEEIFEITLPDLDGEMHTYEVHFVAERNLEEIIIGAMSLGHDITERKQTEQELINAKKSVEESERKFKAIANQATEGIALADNDGHYVFVNPAFCSMLGYSEEELLTMTVFDLRADSQFPGSFNESKTTKLGAPIRVNLRRKDGSEFISEIIGSIVNIEGKGLVLGTIRDITERQKMEEALRESEEKYRLIAENTADTIAVFDLQLNYQYVSPSVFNLLGYTSEEMMNLTLEKLMSPASWQMVQQTYSDEMQLELEGSSDPNRSKVFVTEQYRKDGAKIWVEGTASFVRDQSGKPINILSISRNISDRKAAVDALKESEIRFRTLVEQSPFSTQIFDPEGNTLIANKAFSNLWNVSEQDMTLILKHYNILKDEQHEANGIMPYIKRGFDGEYAQIPAIYYNPRKTAVVSKTELIPKWVKGYIWPVLDEEGKVRQVVLMHEDITERKQSEEEVHKLSHAIQQSPVAVVITNLDGEIEYANPKTTELSGYSSQELFGKNPRILSSGSMPNQEYEDLWTVITSGKEWRGEFQNKKKNGELYWVSALISPIFSETGEIIRYLAVQEDITEKKKMINELITAKEKAEEMNMLKSNFLANMSHELRTPLNGILGYASILTSSLEDNEFIEMSKTIYTSGKRLSETLNLILDLSKAETEKLEIVGKNVNIQSKINSIVTSFKSDAAKKNLLLESIPVAEDVYALLDENLFERAISNLIRNAIKFTEKGKITVEVGKEISEQRGWVYIKVTDTGIGIPEDKINLIWEEFRQASEGMARNYEGTGLGLTISKRVIEMMHGKVSVESKVGVGSVFTVLFPSLDYALQFDENAKRKDQLIEKSEKGKIEILKPKTILYVEDDFINQNVVQLYLKEICKVETARDGKQALQLASEKNYELVLMDINLGFGMDGITVTKELRKMKQYAHTPIVAITAYAMESDKKEFLAGGCTHYLSKPFDKQELLTLVTSIVKPKK